MARKASAGGLCTSLVGRTKLKLAVDASYVNVTANLLDYITSINAGRTSRALVGTCQRTRDCSRLDCEFAGVTVGNEAALTEALAFSRRCAGNANVVNSQPGRVSYGLGRCGYDPGPMC